MSWYKPKPHTKGPDCKICCCSGATKCEEPGCEGWVHQNVVDETEYGEDDWTWVHNYKCDTCGYKSYFYEDQEVEIE